MDQQRGLVFPARIRLTGRDLREEAGEVTVSAGMAVMAEVVTGERRVAEFILAPVMKSVSEAGRER